MNKQNPGDLMKFTRDEILSPEERELVQVVVKGNSADLVGDREDLKKKVWDAFWKKVKG